MDNSNLYNRLFESAFQKIKQYRDPHAERSDLKDLHWNEVKKQALFVLEDDLCVRYANIMSAAKRLTIACLRDIFLALFAEYGINARLISGFTTKERDESPILFAYKIEDTKELLLFKNIESSSVFKNKTKEPAAVQQVLQASECLTCKYIYLMYDKAYLQFIGHTDDKDDPGRGYNAYSIKWFMESYFSEEEYMTFTKCLNGFLNDIQDYLGIIGLKTLNSNALINFRRVVANKLSKFPYQELLNITVTNRFQKNYRLNGNDYNLIKTQFFSKNYVSILIGDMDFSESLITAEWLYDSMEKAKAIDLTVIGLGYFKATEQLMYRLICLHKNEGRKIQKDNSKKELPSKVELSTDNINAENIDTTLGSMANFFKDNMDIFRSDISSFAKNYVKETLYSYANLRNGYFHKDNIHDWGKINDVRNASLSVMFLLLGSMLLEERDKKDIGYCEELVQSDFYRLCEYTNYHYGDLFFLDLEGYPREVMAFAYYDPKTTIKESRLVQYSGVFFKELGKNGRVVQFTEDALPKKVSLGKFVFSLDEMIDAKPVIVKTIFENGVFVGPDIVDEDSFDY